MREFRTSCAFTTSRYNHASQIRAPDSITSAHSGGTMLKSRWSQVLLCVGLLMLVSVNAFAQTKFYAWSTQWYDTPFPLQLANGLDPRQDRQYVPWTWGD